jgi:hypothetical protein
MGSIKPGEQLWLQFIVRAHKPEKRGGFFSPKEDWRKAAEAEVKKFLKKLKPKAASDQRLVKLIRFMLLNAVLGKFPYDVGIRVIYAPR